MIKYSQIQEIGKIQVFNILKLKYYKQMRMKTKVKFWKCCKKMYRNQLIPQNFIIRFNNIKKY